MILLDDRVKIYDVPAEVGDLIKFTGGVVALVLEGDEIALLKFDSSNDWFKLAEGYKYNFEERDYEIIAKSYEWKIVIGGEE